MLQILQHQKTGKITVEELPPPALQKGGVLLRNVASLISVGTERASLETARSSLLGKMNRRPDLTRQVLENLKREGALNTYRKVRTRLDTYKEPGYSCSGIVLESSTEELVPGDRVACGGAEFAHHAGIVFVPKNLVVKIPGTVSFEDGAFVTLASVALQGVRQAGVQLAECVAVVGLGLVGLLTVQLLRAAGCKVFGYDIAETNFALAKQFGCTHCSTNREDSLVSIHSHTGGHGADAVIITAATTSGEPMEAAVEFAREKGCIVVVGDVGMNLQRKGFYEKELELRLSRSYGPGRYDKRYEQGGEDYPRAFVRWTANRNMDAVVDCLSTGMLNVQPLISHRFPIRKAADAYDLIVDPNRKCLGIVIQHEQEKVSQTPPVVSQGIRPVSGPVIGVIGAGNFALSYLLPHLKGVRLKRLATLRSSSALSAARKFPFEAFGTNADEIFQDPEINAVVIATRHDSHAALAVRALESGKHLFVEKPLAISREELDSLAQARSAISNPPVLMVGFNRRFSQPVQEVKKFFQGSRQPLSINYRINAGHLPPEHWIFDDEQGGRIIGEVCHFVDLISFLADAQPVRVFAESSGNSKFDKSVTVNLRLSDGSAGVIQYITDGDISMPKEYCEISSGGKTAVIDNFTEVVFHKGGKKKRKKFDGSKGHRQEVVHFINVLTGREKPGVEFEDLYRSSLATLLVQESLHTGAPQDVTT